MSMFAVYANGFMLRVFNKPKCVGGRNTQMCYDVLASTHASSDRSIVLILGIAGCTAIDHD